MIKNCEQCGREFKTFPSTLAKGKGKYCSLRCYAEAQRTGGLKDGYMRLSINGKRVLEHRLVMAETLGRDLTDEEVVHHIDEDKLNNAIENLQLFPNNSAHRKFHQKEKA